MARVTVYGIGGYDETKPNNNIIEEYEIESPEPETDITVIAEALAQLPEETLNALKQALGL